MKHASASIGRVFVLRLEHGDRLPDCIEAFAAQQNLKQGLVYLIGAIDDGGRMVCGPADPASRPVQVLIHQLAGVHEGLGLGTLFPDEDGAPRLHFHAAFGRDGQTRLGCTRAGIAVWQVAEAVILELTGPELARRRDPATGFETLAID